MQELNQQATAEKSKTAPKKLALEIASCNKLAVRSPKKPSFAALKGIP